MEWTLGIIYIHIFCLNVRREVEYRFPIAPTREYIHPMKGGGGMLYIKGKVEWDFLVNKRRTDVKYRFSIVPAQRNSRKWKE
jgi:hypothetical protein